MPVPVSGFMYTHSQHTHTPTTHIFNSESPNAGQRADSSLLPYSLAVVSLSITVMIIAQLAKLESIQKRPMKLSVWVACQAHMPR